MEREGSLVPGTRMPERPSAELRPEKYPDPFIHATALHVQFVIRNLLGRHRGAAEFLRDVARALDAVPEARA